MKRFFLIVILLTAIFPFVTRANVSLPEIFSDNMVLQQKAEVVFWGWAGTFEKVTLKADWMTSEISVAGDVQGMWKLTVTTPSAGGPFTIHIKGNNEIILKNVLVGEVWLCSGQSNMEWSARSGINNAEEEIRNAVNTQVRLFSVCHCTSHYPQDHFAGTWDVCSPETMQSFSFIAYYFANELQKKLGVPVGVINSSWGGTPAEAWMPEEATQYDDYLKEAAALQKPVPWGPVEPGRIYNSMINPLVPFRIAGALWYQGEANTINAYAYKEMLESLIYSWRDRWGYDFPFYYAQIAPYKYGKPFEGVMVRDAQRRALEVAGTGMVVLSDIGDTANIHPKNKQAAALRFANLALNRTYHALKSQDSGPLYREMSVENDRVVVTFDNSEGLHAAGNVLTCFEIAGTDMEFYPAKAFIKDGKVTVMSDKVKKPFAVRYAWSNTATPNLFNGAGLPASCFTTEY
ncbi:MAG TPA: sialate O-acetylesterase [Bacteroidales bacterium]|nr:sialate O-acetylesterase [Bacteroidales bacterium]